MLVTAGKNKGKPPSVASLYRAFAEAEAAAEQAAANDRVTLRPKPAPIRQRSEPETPEEAELHDRLQAQVLQRRAGQ